MKSKIMMRESGKIQISSNRGKLKGRKLPNTNMCLGNVM